MRIVYGGPIAVCLLNIYSEVTTYRLPTLEEAVKFGETLARTDGELAAVAIWDFRSHDLVIL